MIDNANCQCMIECLHRLWNEVWRSGVVPRSWKLEHRILLPKPGKENYNECSSYRTISITDILGKWFEKVVSTRLVCHLEKKGFDECQFAYLKKRSATQAVLSLAEQIKRNKDNGNLTGVLFFDFTDAFGLVNRVKLIQKLRQDIGITGILFLYLISFLSGRQARIKVNTLIGKWIDSVYGTSAGTVLGAVLFLTYVHDTPDCIKYKFADDLATIAVDNDARQVEYILQHSLNSMDQWSKKWDMKLNAGKTKVMLFGSHQVKLNVSLLGLPIEQVSKMKYLGVWLDEHLNFDDQAKYAASKAKLQEHLQRLTD